MKDEPNFELREALRSLPRHRAEEGFTDAVLERLAEGGGAASGRPARPPLRWLAAAAGLAGLLAAGSWLLPPGSGAPGTGSRGDPPKAAPEAGVAHEAPSARSRLEALAAERARLEEELRDLRRLVEARDGTRAPDDPGHGAPVLYLGGTEDVDLVLDLGRLAEDRSARRAVPAGYRE